MEKRKIHRKAVILGIIFSLALIPNLAFAQDDPNAVAYQRAVVLSRRLSPEEKVGQLFMITMDGDDISESSEIYQLITNYYIGGVVLKDENQNFQGEATTNQIYNLISGLQNIEWSVRNERRETEADVIQNDYVPLFIGVSQPGGSYPHDSIFSSLTPLPSQMAIGATWDPATAFSIGEINGRELETLGFNLILCVYLWMCSILPIRGTT